MKISIILRRLRDSLLGLLAMLANTGCHVQNDASDDSLQGTWTCPAGEAFLGAGKAGEKVPAMSLKLQAQHRFSGEMLMGDGVHRATGQWRRVKDALHNPMPGETAWAVVFTLETKDDAPLAAALETTMALLNSGRLEDEWDGPDNRVSYKR